MIISKTFSLMALFLLVAQGSYAEPVGHCRDGRKTPEWVLKWDAPYKKDFGKAVYGKGKAMNISNPSLLATTADNRAIGEVSNMFKTAVNALINKYRAKNSAEKESETVRTTVVGETLAGVIIVDRCEMKEKGKGKGRKGKGIFYSLAKLDVSAFSSTVDKQTKLGLDIKEFMKNNAAKIFAEAENK
jgi:hypothetical protein